MVNKKEIADRIAEKTGFYKKDVKMMLSAFADVLEESLSKGDTVFFKEVFTMKPVTVKARDNYSHYHHKMMHLDEHTVVKIKLGKRLKECVNNMHQKEDAIEQSGKHSDLK